jgi:hypothetical protein
VTDTICPSYGPTDHRQKIALIQPGSWGDNINSTIMFGPIRRKWPDAVLDVYSSSLYGSAFINNPYITNLILFPADTKQAALHLLTTIPARLTGHGYDHVFRPHPMVNPDKWTAIKSDLGTNLICAWVRALEDADIPYTVPIESSLRLTDHEIDNVSHFLQSTGIASRNILMEVQGESGQTFWNATWTTEVGKYLLNGHTHLFLSRRQMDHDFQTLKDHAPDHVHFAGSLSIRECAELFNRCHAFFSVSSGLSNACNTSWCKKDGKWIETTNSSTVSSAPIRSTGKIFWHNNNLASFLQMLTEQGL